MLDIETKIIGLDDEQTPKPKHPKQFLINFVESEGGVIWSAYDTDSFYNVIILSATEVALSGLLYRKPNCIMYHISYQTGRFEFFIDRDVIL